MRNIDWQMTSVKIKEMMKEWGYTVKEMATLLCLSESALKNYIYSGTKIPLEVLYDIISVFHLNEIEDIIVFKSEI